MACKSYSSSTPSNRNTPGLYSKSSACRSRKEISSMAKKSIVARDAKRIRMIEKYAEKRKELKELGDQEGLAKLPRNSSPTRRTNRCVETGRSRGYMRQFGLSRISFREHASKGEIPGVTKSSW